jgi:hypothetical protein
MDSVSTIMPLRDAQSTPMAAPEGFWPYREGSRRPAAWSSPTFVSPFRTRLAAASPARTTARAQPGRRRQRANEKIWRRNRRDFPGLVSQPLFEDFGNVGHPIEFARTDEALTRSPGRRHRQQLQCRDVAHVHHRKAHRGNAGIEPSRKDRRPPRLFLASRPTRARPRRRYGVKKRASCFWGPRFC